MTKLNLIDRIFEGARSPLIGIRFLFSGPKLWKWAAIPVLLTIFILTAGTIWAGTIFGGLLGSLTTSVAGLLTGLPVIGPWFSVGALGYQVTEFISGLTLFLASVILWAYSCYVGAKLVLIPFSSVMAEKTLQHLGVLRLETQSSSLRAKRFIRSLWTGVIQVFFLSLMGIILFALSFIPGLQPFVGLGGMLLVSFDCSDYALESADLSFKEKLKVFAAHLPEFLGFATVAGLTFLIPVLNLLLLPALVIGAARLVSQFTEVWEQK